MSPAPPASPRHSPNHNQERIQPLEITVEPASESSSLHSPSSARHDDTPPKADTALEVVDLTKPPCDPTLEESEQQKQQDTNASNTGSKRSVRFRSRVRITSGFHRHKQRRPSLLSPEISSDGFHVRSNSTSSSFSESSSPSSSISAPLKYRRDSTSTYNDDEGEGWARGRGRWRPLGQRIQFLPRQGINERSSLLANGSRRRYAGDHDQEDLFEETEEDYAEAIAKEIDMVFGTWPGRLLNRHWWWWQLEPVVCCLCMEDDYDE